MNAPLAPPYSLEAEQSLLGALFINNAAFDSIADVVTVDDFYRDDHRRIWSHICKLIEAGKPADVVTVYESIALSDDKEKIGGPAYLAALSQSTPSSLNIRRYAELVHERAVQRKLAQAAETIAEKALNPAGKEIGEILDEAESLIFQIAESGARRGAGLVPIDNGLAEVYRRMDDLHQRGDRSGITGLPTGYSDLDRMTAGLQPSDLIIVAGRPSMGKTALALNIAENAALKRGLHVAIFSMEMSAPQLALRMLGSISRVDQHKLRTGQLTDGEWGVITEAMGRLHGQPIHIDDTAAITALELRARARRLKRQHPSLGLIVVDYLQLMTATTQGENRATEVSEMSRSLKGLARELDVPVIALSQLTRAVDQRADRRPMMSDLRESGAIEQDADLILFIYREEVYSPDKVEARGRAEIIIGKQRNGPIGSVPLTFLGRYTRFENYESEHRYS